MVEAKGWLATNKCLAVASDNRLIRIHPGRCRSDNPRRAGGNTQSSRLLRRMATVAMPSSTLTTRQMPDEHYSSTSWDYVDNTSGASPTASHASHSYNGRPSMSTPAREQGSSRGSPNTDPSPPPPYGSEGGNGDGGSGSGGSSGGAPSSFDLSELGSFARGSQTVSFHRVLRSSISD